MNTSIRNEVESDYRAVEELTREAFWNLYVPGCDEHFLAHIMRKHPDFIPILDFVAVCEDKIVGNIMYTRSYIVDESNNRIETITFGPISVLPEYQRQGIGSALIQHSTKIAAENKFNAIIIQGHPKNYCKHGFKSSKDFMVSDSEGRYPFGLLVLEIEKDMFQGHTWKYYLSDVYSSDPNAAAEFDQQFSFKKKEYRYTQEEFSIAYRAYLT
jgi:putative acetyltransferase